jgi:CDP-diacylglycerol---serine O-phosphatidyltransferase
MIKQIPNIFTLLNLILGCMAIVFILQTESFEIHQEYADTISIVNLPESMQWGCICIFLAAVVDFLDGFVARLLKASSAMGAQLDSLSDVVSFGVAPSLIMWQLLRITLINDKSAINYPQAWLWPALFIAACGAWRLARFNISTTQSKSFVGLPIPAAGMLIATLPMAVFYNTFNLSGFILNAWFLYGVIALVGWLMVSNLRLMAMKFSQFSVKKYMHIVILLVISVISIVVLRWYAGIVILLAYVALSLVYKNKLEQ